jgi:hypothetical protein
MSKFIPPQTIPSPIPEDRFAQNDDLPSSTALRRAAWAFNHASQQQRKVVFFAANTALSTTAPADASEYHHVFCFRTGENVEALTAIIGMAPASQTDGSNKASCLLHVNDGSGINSAPAYYPFVQSGTYTPSEVAWTEVEITAADGLLPDTLYRGGIRQDSYSRVHSVTVFERAANVGDSSVVGVANPLLYEANKPLYDAGIQDLCETGTKLWRHNGAQLISWSRRDPASAPVITSTSYVNIIDQSFTAWDAAAPGFQISTEYHDSANGDVPVEFGVYGFRLDGGGLSTLSIKLVQDGATVLERTGISAANAPFDNGAYEILAHAPTKTDILAKVSGGSWSIDAIGLWEYEA